MYTFMITLIATYKHVYIVHLRTESRDLVHVYHGASSCKYLTLRHLHCEFTYPLGSCNPSCVAVCCSL